MADTAQEIVGAGGSQAAPASPHRTASALYWHLVWLYVQGSVVSVILIFILAALGLDFSAHQWVTLLIWTTPVVAFYMGPDIYFITKQFGPIRKALERLDRGETPTQAEASAALV